MKPSFIIMLGLMASVTAAELKEGTFTLSIKRGNLEQTVLYTKKGEQLRLEYPGKHIPAKPYNLINAQSGEVIIARPINSTWTLVPAKRLAIRKPSPFPEPPAPPAGIGAKPSPAGTPGTPPAPAAAPQPAAPVVPKIPSATVPVIPKIPTPSLPDGSPLPKGIGPQPDGGKSQPAPGSGSIPGQVIPGQPAIPGIPGGIPGGMPMIPGQSEQMQLTKGKESKKIHGYLCQKYLMTLPSEGEMTLWLSDATDLPLFYLPLHAAPRTRGRTDWARQWPAVLREKKLFPMLAILRVAPQKTKESEGATIKQGREIARWKVSAISSKPITDKEKTLFTVPKNYHQIEAPHF